MGKIAFLEIEDVLRIHARQIKRFGGDPGIRDAGLLESALAMPRASFDGEFVHEDVPAMAGAYLFHLAKNHAFIDGNKRVALGAALYFLHLNGIPPEFPDQALESCVMSVAAGSMTKDQATAFLRTHISPTT